MCAATLIKFYFFRPSDKGMGHRRGHDESGRVVPAGL